MNYHFKISPKDPNQSKTSGYLFLCVTELYNILYKLHWAAVLGNYNNTPKSGSAGNTKILSSSQHFSKRRTVISQWKWEHVIYLYKTKYLLAVWSCWFSNNSIGLTLYFLCISIIWKLGLSPFSPVEFSAASSVLANLMLFFFPIVSKGSLLLL